MTKSRPLIFIHGAVDPTDMMHIKAALADEEKAVQEYTAWAEETDDPDLQEIFQHMAADERYHSNTLRHYLQYGEPPKDIE